MPRHTIYNRRNVDPFGRHTVSMATKSYNRMQETADMMGVSQGSLCTVAVESLLK